MDIIDIVDKYTPTGRTVWTTDPLDVFTVCQGGGRLPGTTVEPGGQHVGRRGVVQWQVGLDASDRDFGVVLLPGPDVAAGTGIRLGKLVEFVVAIRFHCERRRAPGTVRNPARVG